ncbi:signal peptidase I [Streptomyces sp. NPDC020719]|uniref:signal peptidase I n=1 Tax=Streptomyces sp. NPDC020719 TaxID=3154896 RepID=UPI003407ECD3
MGDVAVGAQEGHGEAERPRQGPEGLDRPQGFEGPEGLQEPKEPTGPEGSPAPAAFDEVKAKKQRSFWKELPLLIGIALVLALLIKTFLVQAFSIPSDSMQNTLQRGDRVLVDKLTPWFGSEPERGEVVVFHDPGNWLQGEPTPQPNAVQKALSFVGLMPSAEEKDLIKRVVAVGGDTVECKGAGPLKVNGKALDEPYVFAGNTACSTDQPGQFKITVPKGRIWVMGDHRQNSADSRYHQDQPDGGSVPVDKVVGRALVIAWPLDRLNTLSVPGTFGQPGIGNAEAAAPAALGLLGALPIVLVRRRRRLAR